MRRTIVVALALAAAAAPAALAARPADPPPNRPPHPVHPNKPPQPVTPARPSTPQPANPARPRPVAKVAFIVRGVVTATADDSITVQVKGFNAHARRAFAGEPRPLSVVVRLDAATRVTKAGKGRARISDIAVSDRVVVAWKAPRRTDAAGLAALAAKRVVDHGPKPAPRTPPAPPAPPAP